MATSISSLHAKISEHLEAAQQTLEWLEESDRYWRERLRSLEQRQNKKFGVTKANFDKLYYTAMEDVELGSSRKLATLGRSRVHPSTSQTRLWIASLNRWPSAVSATSRHPVLWPPSPSPHGRIRPATSG